jgi:hypothetical protein
MTALVVTALTATAACSAGGSAASSGEGGRTTATEASVAASAEAAPANEGARIPDGSWSTVHTIADARREGLSPREVRTHLGEDRQLPVTLRIAGDRWVLLATEDDGVAVPGDDGTLTYDDRGRAVMESESMGCGGCVGTYVWRLEGDVLTMRLATAISPDLADDDVARMITQGDFRRAR